ncbi:Methyltransferase domain-containing protein [Carnobacterium iners]|uniref:Methyltransferase domain-containing protein n=1 Tax=Carnobacterium iners TaxID=1073423 RepID=A0A1X7MWS4_9LACT|nr:methyltransferase domain-containing protein [Carnobacterium iners]SEK55136.1 Methyltransferase domain-containing protein [Carnobacterium iners]SMH28405.1 Methyltransferase domain-containing protein [Carnobacterium iners]
MSNETKKIKNRYNCISKIYDVLEGPMEAMTKSAWNEKLIDAIEGKKVLEVGVGTGKNLLFYPDNVEIIGIDFSEQMLKKAIQKTKGKETITLIEMDAQKMSFADDTFDTVVTSCVFCSVPDPVEGLKEIRRVCKPNGKIVMLEHMRSQHRLVGKVMDAVNFIPLHTWGANINRKTLENIVKAGFKEEQIETQDLWSDIVKLIEIRNKK